MVSPPSDFTIESNDRVNENTSVRFFDPLNVFVAPRSTLNRLQSQPMYRWSLAWTSIMMISAAILMAPDTDRVQSIMFLKLAATHSGNVAQKYREAASQHSSLLGTVLSTILGTMTLFGLTSLAYAFAGALFGTIRSSRHVLAATAASLPIFGIASLLNAVILTILGTGAITDFSSLFALPSLALFGKTLPMRIALSVLNPINAWYYFESAASMNVVLGIPWRIALSTSTALLLVSMAFYYAVATILTNLMGA